MDLIELITKIPYLDLRKTKEVTLAMRLSYEEPIDMENVVRTLAPLFDKRAKALDLRMVGYEAVTMETPDFRHDFRFLLIWKVEPIKSLEQGLAETYPAITNEQQYIDVLGIR